jgi:hypothetical protein
MAASLNDSNILGTNTAFVGRVQSALLSACVSIFNEGNNNRHVFRVQLVHSVMSNPTALANWANTFALAVCTDASVLADATQAGTVALTTSNVLAQQALVTDAHINSALSSMFDAFCPGIPA